jgi:bifunctional NMN adenylyltransferase/nudix hydrolase
VRDKFFVPPGHPIVVDYDKLPDNVAAFLHAFAETPDYAWLVEEAAWYGAQRKKFSDMGFQVPPPIVTSDAVVIQSGHVLTCERLRRPGKGLICLPGDKLRGDTFADSILDTLVRRLGLMVTPTRPERIARQTVKGRVTAVELFDHPYSSERAHLISQIRLVEFIDDERGLPSIGRGTETLRPIWMPIEEIDPQTVFEDQWHKLQKMLTRAEER